MKRFKFCIQNVQALLICVMLSLVCESCSAKAKGSSWTQFAQIDSIVKVHLGDSITKAIVGSKKIIISELTTESDSLEYLRQKTLKKNEQNLLLFLFLDKDMMHKPSENIYGKFCPMIRVEFIGKKGITLTLYLDLGLSQWSLHDSANNEITKGAIHDRRMIRLFNFLLPESELLKHLYNFEPQK